jgi:hypothetical protein
VFRKTNAKRMKRTQKREEEDKRGGVETTSKHRENVSGCFSSCQSQPSSPLMIKKTTAYQSQSGAKPLDSVNPSAPVIIRGSPIAARTIVFRNVPQKEGMNHLCLMILPPCIQP